jgi:hypothetical protein
MEITASNILIFIIIGFTLPVCLTIINILQNGIGGYKGQDMEAILGQEVTRAGVSDLIRLSKAQLMQLFYAAPAPGKEDLDGEYQAQLIPVGVLAGPTAVFTHRFFGPGRWVGKAFKPLKNTPETGYNLFQSTKAGGVKKVHRARSMRLFVGPSRIDTQDSLHLDYSPFNAGVVHSMHDEIRRINSELYLGMGYMGMGGGPINPAPFVVYGPAEPWIGPDLDPESRRA